MARTIEARWGRGAGARKPRVDVANEDVARRSNGDEPADTKAIGDCMVARGDVGGCGDWDGVDARGRRERDRGLEERWRGGVEVKVQFDKRGEILD